MDKVSIWFLIFVLCGFWVFRHFFAGFFSWGKLCCWLLNYFERFELRENSLFHYVMPEKILSAIRKKILILSAINE